MYFIVYIYIIRKYIYIYIYIYTHDLDFQYVPECRPGVWPPMPATPPAVVRKQRTRVTALEKNMAAARQIPLQEPSLDAVAL